MREILPGYGWIFPLGGGLYNVGIVVFPKHRLGGVSNVREAFGLFAGGCGPARELIAAAEEVGPLRGGMLRCGLRGSRLLGPGNVVAVGEAAGTTLPLLGEGVGKAMETGEMAAQVIQEVLANGDVRGMAAYPRRVGRELRPLYRGYRFGERCIGLAWLNDFMSSRVTRSPLLRELMAGLISGTRDPREVFSVGPVIRSFWR
jgi:flavin-dependent dehydrogenase